MSGRVWRGRLAGFVRGRALFARRALEQRDRLADRAGVRRQLGEQRAEHARAGHRVGQRAVHALDLDAERVGERGQPAPALQRRDPPRQRDRAEDRRVGPRQRRAVEGLAQHARVEAGVVRDEHPPAHLRRQLGQHALGRRRGVDHRLRDAGEALDAARERLRDADERAPAVVQLAAADQHRADLGQLAEVLAEPVGLGVDGEELRGEQGLCGEVVHEPPFLRLAPDAVHVRVQKGYCLSGDRGTDLRMDRTRSAGPRRLWRRRRLREQAPSPRTDQRDRRDHQLPRQRLAAALRRRADRPDRLQPGLHGPEGDLRDRRARRLAAGNKFDTTPINPRGTATLKVDVREGDWKLSTGDGGIRAAAVSVGQERKSAQGDLLQP